MRQPNHRRRSKFLSHWIPAKPFFQDNVAYQVKDDGHIREETATAAIEWEIGLWSTPAWRIRVTTGDIARDTASREKPDLDTRIRFPLCRKDTALDIIETLTVRIAGGITNAATLVWRLTRGIDVTVGCNPIACLRACAGVHGAPFWSVKRHLIGWLSVDSFNDL